ncbi:MAG: helix-turn-helix transcriptional regulator [Opitutaceae bacterium]|jgi:DNA-binding NarL/FixJ family response regulator|nr:helix-turn-helix transcriptional regulator [Opitutaceae bacterium]
MPARPLQLRRLLETIETFHTAASLEELHRAITAGVARLVPGDTHDLVLCQPACASEAFFYSRPQTYTGDEIAFMLAHADEHPVARAYAAGGRGAISVSQCAGDRAWRGSRLYREGGYRRLSLHHEIAIDIPGRDPNDGLAVFSVARGGFDFDAGERHLLDLLRPHIARAWEQASRRQAGSSVGGLLRRFPRLSQREAEVLHWIVEGKQNGEIAGILQLRLGTVQEHVENILRKLRMENRHQLTVHVLRACLGR